jgi:hypothetical protein
MTTRLSPASVRTVLGFAAASAACALALGWPSPTHADGASPLVQYMIDGTKVGDVVAKGAVSRDPNATSGWVIVVTAHNEADHAEEVPLETDLTRHEGSPMARVVPPPQIAWSRKETITVPAHGEVTLRYDVPAALGPQLAAATAEKQDLNAISFKPVVSFAVAFDQSSLPNAGSWTPPRAKSRARRAPASAPLRDLLRR